MFKTTYVYTDGSVLNNMRRNSKITFGGIGVYFGDDDPRNVSEPFFEFPITNIRTEIKAPTKAIEKFMEYKISKKDDTKEKLVIYTDSEFLINAITKWIKVWKLNGWKTANKKDVKNKDLIYALDHKLNLVKDFIDVEFRHVKAHRDIKTINPDKTSIEYKEWYGNMMADKLATDGSAIAKKAMEKKSE